MSGSKLKGSKHLFTLPHGRLCIKKGHTKNACILKVLRYVQKEMNDLSYGRTFMDTVMGKFVLKLIIKIALHSKYLQMQIQIQLTPVPIEIPRQLSQFTCLIYTFGWLQAILLYSLPLMIGDYFLVNFLILIFLSNIFWKLN